MKTPTRPALRWFGGKWLIANWIASHFPPHYEYFEPCFGGGSVLIRKQMSGVEVANDLDGRVFNFFSVLRDQSAELIRRVELTPWHESEYETAKSECEDPIEDARRFFFACWASIGGGPKFNGFRWIADRGGRYASPPDDLINHDLATIANRLRHVHFLRRDAMEVMERAKNSPTTLIYFDPPYPKSTRVAKSVYAHEMGDDLHTQAAEVLTRTSAHVVVSGYQCDLYKSLYEDRGFVRHDRVAQANSGATRIESVWLAPHTNEAVARQSKMSF